MLKWYKLNCFLQMAEHQLCIRGLLWGAAHRNQAKKIKLPKNENFVITCNKKLIIFGEVLNS
ncbi:hypothetical protein CMV37_29390 [Bacillus cereus]|nr:hypothetical protein CMV37_29390 [Bacillus cereus]